jgi:cytochrome P450
MAAMTTGTSHAVLRRSMQRLYSNSLLSTSSDFQKVLLAVIQDTCAELSQAAETQEPVNIFALSAGAGLDSCTGHFLGVQHRTTSVRNAKEYTDWMWMLDADEVSSFWTTEMPVVVKVLSYVGLVPWSQQIQSRRQAMSQYTLKSLQDSIDEVESPNYNATYPNSRLQSSRPLLYESLRDLPDLPGSSQKKSSRFLYYAAELLDQLAAGSANLAVALGYCCFELSRHSNIQKALREELLKLQGQYGLKIDTPIVPPTILSELDKLPLLEACLTETMRLYPPVTGQLPRFVPPGGFTCDGFFIPKGTSVSAAAYNLHREEAVFEDPERWDPYRWIGCPVEVQKKMRTWIWSYGSGTYQCAGVHMARHSKSPFSNIWYVSLTRMKALILLPQ